MALGSTSVAAMSRETLRNLMLTSMYGRKAGFDFNGYEVGENDTRLVIDNVGTTVATSLSPSGCSIFSSTPASSALYTLQQAVPGIYKLLEQVSSSTLGFALQFNANTNIVTSAGSSFNQIIFQGIGHVASLFCASTAVWLSASPPSPGLTYSTF